ncbi:MAG TPA: condensation domain-containing protein, partial [Pyrinomonadaceae bacterium]|nr:condensation domain-containing protein [Pyrinomonadaceae bacterium]
VGLGVEDLSAEPAAEREARARELAQAEARQPFDLGEGLLLRARLLRLGEDDHVALLTMHHIASDGWSVGVIVQELAALYEAFAEGRPSPLAELPAQYADYALWQREWLRGEVLERELDFWRQYLGGRLPVLELKADRPRLAARSYRGAGVVLEVGAELTEGLRQLARREGATLYMTLLAAYKILLRHFGGSDDILVGSPVNVRRRARFEGLIGFFINSLVLRTDLSGDPTFAQLLARVREGALGAFSHADVPFERLVEELQPERSRSHTPLFQVWMNLEQDSAFEVSVPRLKFGAFRLEKETAQFDLALLAREQAETIECMFEYSTDLFEEATAARFARSFESVLRQITADPHVRLGALKQALDEQERAARLAEERVYESSVQQRLRGLRRRVAQ